MSRPGRPYNHAPMSRPHEFILTLSCPDAKGIVHSVSGLLYQAGCNIIDSQQFGDVQDAITSMGLRSVTPAEQQLGNKL